MKLKPNNSFLFPLLAAMMVSAINSASVALAVNATGLFSPIALQQNSHECWVRLSPFGEFPVTIQKDGADVEVTQVMDVAAANEMKKNFDHFITKVVTWGKGLPYLEGHPDDPNWAKANGGGAGKAVGRIKKLDVRDDGLYGYVAFNSAGVELLIGDSPAYAGHSPHWRMIDIPGEPTRMRPVLLVSMGLTNTPNIRDNGIALNAAGEMELDETSAQHSTDNVTEETEPDMKLNPDLLKRLGLGENPDQAALEAAIIKLLDAAATADAKVQTAEASATAANSSLTSLKAELDSLRQTQTEAAINAAVETGRITAADKDKWTAALNASYATELVKLNALMPALNTTSKIGDLNKRAGEGAAVGADALQAAVNSYAKENGVDASTPEGWQTAWMGAKKANPDLFKI